MKYVYGKKMKTLKDRLTTGVAALALLANSVGMSLPFVLTQRVAAATVNVCATDCDYTSIQSAIDGASPGDIIVVGDGTYNENVSINKSITLVSASGATNTTISPASGNAISFPTGNGVVRDSITIDGFTLVSSPGAIALQANSHSNDGYNSTNLTYRNLVIDANGGTGLGLFDVNGITIDNVSISGATLGIEAIGVANLTMTSSSITGSTNTGVNVWTHAGYEANDNLTFTNNTFTNNATGLKFVNTSNAAVNGGTISGGTIGVMSQGSSVTVDGVTFDGIHPSNNHGYAVVGFGGAMGGTSHFGSGTYGANTLTVENSTFTNIGRTGTVFSGSQSTGVFESNTYTGKGDSGLLDYAVDMWYGTKVTITGNTVTNNLGTASDGSKSSAISVWDDGTVATITGNTLNNNTYGVAGVYDGSIIATQNNITNNTMGISATLGATANATENWWGDQSGPDGAGPGTGDAVSANVTFSPWLCAPAPSALTTTDGACDTTPPNAPNNLRLQVRSTGNFVGINGWTSHSDVTALWDSNNTEAVTYEYQYWNDVVTSPYNSGNRWINPVASEQYAGVVNQGEGKHYFCVIAIDLAGNRSVCSATFSFNYDVTNPVTDINVSTPVNGTFTVSGDASDNLRLNRVYVQLVSRVTGLRCGGTTVHFVADNTDTASWSVDYNLATLGASCPEGDFAAHVEVVDMAGNRGTAGWTEDFLVEAPQVLSAVTACKVDQIGNKLNGWQLALLGEKVETLPVNSKTNTVSNQVSSSTLPAGDYIVKASGTFKYRGGTQLVADARFSERLPSDPSYGGSYSPWATGNTGWLHMNGDNTVWGTVLNPSHVYYAPLSLSADGTVQFYVGDDNHSDNVGNLAVEIYTGYTGVTGEDGCVTFDDVPHGDYTVEELLQAGWQNISGLGPVEIDEPEVTVTVANHDPSLPPAPQTLSWVESGEEGAVLECGATTNNPLGAATWSAVDNAAYYLYQFMRPGSDVWEDGGTYTDPTTGDNYLGTVEGTPGTWKFRVKAVLDNGKETVWSVGCPITFELGEVNACDTETCPIDPCDEDPNAEDCDDNGGDCTVEENTNAGGCNDETPDGPDGFVWEESGLLGDVLECGATTNNPLGALTWNAVSGAVHYVYEFQRPGSDVWESGGTYANPTTGDNYLGAVEGIPGTWQFRVKAVFDDGSETDWSVTCPVTFVPGNVNACDTETCPIVEKITGDGIGSGNVLGLSDGLTNTGTQNGGLLVFIASSLMAIALLSLRRKQEN